MASTFASARAHGSFDSLFQPSLVSGPSKVTWRPVAAPSEERFIGTFPLADAGVDDGFLLRELSELHLALTESGSSSNRLRHISVRLSSLRLVLSLLIHPQRLAHTLHPIIIATFLDCAPAAFGLSSVNPTALELIASVTDISRSLYGVILQGGSFVRFQQRPLESGVLTLAAGRFEERFKRSEYLAWAHGCILPVHRQWEQARYQGVYREGYAFIR